MVEVPVRAHGKHEEDEGHGRADGTGSGHLESGGVALQQEAGAAARVV
jgi:hypothetical protein